ncbi:MAG: LacI family DNA-binding transcriptional regulator [Roseitalea sp.]|jgi:DNA-binding LacI/PurR family transcriptional regulator|nr:LacI family DNA-binding transcriptional regulator [Roseitalea sp.]MBO6721147.1 LacI family DNA-binding transcriptional regulator [Roseitalea sp.]MBO6744205.1 LacI family DNA-binding transcriptional regulator [Roseitalea sp.]
MKEDEETGVDGSGAAAVKAQQRTRPSSIDVARLAGVSQSAVSRAFTEGASVSKKTKEKVFEAARELGYKPSILPRILVTHRSQLVAVVIGGMYNPYYANLFELFTRRFQENGYQVLVFFVDHNEYFDDAIPLIMRYRVDGIISALSLLSDDAADECAHMQVPVVLFNGKRQNKWVSSICSDNVEGGRQIATLLHSKGGKHFAYVTGKETLANTDRQAGYIGRLRELGIENVTIVEGDFHYDGGYLAADTLFSGDVRPDAIFCANDLMAIGVVECAREKYGLDTPKDFMIAGFDGAIFGGWPSYGLTSVRQNAEAMVDGSFELLNHYWQGDETAEGALKLIPGELLERRSTDR